MVDKLQLHDKHKPPDWSEWNKLIKSVYSQADTLQIAIVGKYIELEDAYISIKEALRHAGSEQGHNIEITWIQSSTLEVNNSQNLLQICDGVIVPGGFGERGVEGKIIAAQWARTNKVPYFGLCLGMQVMCIEFARFLLGTNDANSTEFNRDTSNPIIDLMPNQRNIREMGGTMRLGVYPCMLVPGTRASEAYGKPDNSHVSERHRHRFEFNNEYRQIFTENGMVFSGLSPNEELVEIAELSNHPFMLGSQFHPEFISRPNRPHPLFSAFVKASAKTKSSPG